MQKYKDIEQGQGIVVTIIVFVLLTNLISTALSYWIFTPEKYTEFIKSIMIMAQAPEEAVNELITAFEASLRRLDRRLYYNMQLYGGASNFIFLLFLCIFLYLGRTWARCLLTIIMFGGVPGALLMGYLLFNTRLSVTIGLFWMTYAVVTLICTAILLFSSKVRSYAAHMRGA